MSFIQNLTTRVKYFATQTALPQIIFYLLSKICFALMELPHEGKESTYIPYLITDIVLLASAISLKIFRHKFAMIRCLLKMQAQCFLLWIINFIMMVFSWSLLDAISWNFVEKMLVMICQFLSLFMLTLLTKEEFISKMEFIAYQIILGLQIVAVSMKTVSFVKYDSESNNKDIVLLNLTTQIALMIILMDTIEKSYRKWKKLQIDDNMVRFENQMVVTNKVADSNFQTAKSKKGAELREVLQFRQ